MTIELVSMEIVTCFIVLGVGSDGITMLWYISSGGCICSFRDVVGHDCTNCVDLSRDGKFVIGFGFSG